MLACTALGTFTTLRISYAQGSYAEVKTSLENIEKSISEASCGGWDFGQSVGDVPGEGYISRVTNVPGRTGQPLGNITSGMAWRNETDGLPMIDPMGRIAGLQTGYAFPDDTISVCGLKTYCRPPSHPDQRTNLGGEQQDKPKFFCDHPCQRPLDGPPPKGKPAGWSAENSSNISCAEQQPQNPADGVKYACGGGETVSTSPEFCENLQKDGPKGGLCQDLNSWVYVLWRKQVHTCNDIAKTPIYRYQKGPCGFRSELGSLATNTDLCADGYEPVGLYECCSDQPVGGAQVNSDRVETGTDPNGNILYQCLSIGVNTDPNAVGKNCKPCFGADCRRDTDPPVEAVIIDVWFDPHPKDITCPNWPVKPDDRYRRKTEPRTMISYFRDYSNATYERKKMAKHSNGEDLVPNDDNKKSFPVACYGMYDMAPEDAKLVATENFQKRCVVAAYYDDPMNFRKMKETQEGKGELNKDDENILRGLDTFGDGPRPFDEKKSLWYTGLSNAFSILNDERYAELFVDPNDLTFALLAPDSAKQRATVQLDRGRKLSDGSRMRAFDDTVTNDEDPRKDRRTIIEWWQGLSTEMHKVFSPPSVKLLLPSTWSIGLDPLDPLFTPLPKNPPEVPDPRMNPIEVQVHAGEDLLGNLIAFFERSLLLRIEEKPIKIVVPIADPIELRSLAQGWYAWAEKQEKFSGPGVVRARASGDRLNTYADYIDDVRRLRAELPRYAAALLKEQRIVSETLAEWLVENAEAFEEYKETLADLSELKTLWASAHAAFSGIQYGSFKWCRNDRFTTPIYSLNDEWLPGRECDADLSGGYNCSARPVDFTEYDACLERVRTEQPTDLSNTGWAGEPEEICAKFYPPPPALPFYKMVGSTDLLIDFTAFREPQISIDFPVLKNPTQIRLDLKEIRPPGLEHSTEPKRYPADLPDLPPLTTVWEEIRAGFPKVEKLLAAGTIGDGDIALPPIASDLPKIEETLTESLQTIREMSNEYGRFWSAAVREFEDDERGREQDCRDLNTGTCVHFEADLLERVTRIAARPSPFLKEDFESIGAFRKPWIQGHDFCAPEDWTCVLLNDIAKLPREGWQLEFTDDATRKALIDNLRRRVRVETDNVDNPTGTEFFYDVDMDEMYENFSVERDIDLTKRFPPIE